MRAAVADGCLMKSPVAVKGAARERTVQRCVPSVAEVVVLLAARCAMRFGELAALRRDRIDLVTERPGRPFSERVQ